MKTGAHTVLVMGAGGFIGSHIVRALVARGDDVRAHLGPPDVPVARAPSRVKEYVADICDSNALQRMMRGVDIVVHAAGPASVRESFEHPAEYARVHVEGTASILDACRLSGVRRVVYLSSAEVYGRPAHNPVPEDSSLAARSPYAAFKIGGEQLVNVYGSFGMEAVILRPFSIYGAGMSAQSVMGTILDLAARGRPILLNDLRPVRDYCHVTDLAAAVVRSCEIVLRNTETINVGTGKGTSVAGLAGAILRALGRSSPVRQRAQSRRPGGSEIYRLVADTSRASRVLGWTPHESLQSGLRDLAAASQTSKS